MPTVPWTSLLSREQVAAVSARGFGAAVVLILALLEPSGRSAVCAVLLCALAAAAATVTVRRPALLGPTAVAEALVSGVVVGLAVDGFPGALAYTLVPAFVAGLSRRPAMGVSAVLITFCVVDLLALVDGSPGTLADRLVTAVPWLLTSAGGACIAYWLIDTSPAPVADDTGYESARRLLAQLRTVARRLSQGLDPVGIAQQMLVEVDQRVETTRAVVLARSEGGVLLPLAEHGDGTARDLTGEDPLVMDCWTNEAPVQRPVETSDGGRCLRVAVPLQVGGVRMIGVVVLETTRTQPGTALRELRQALAEHCVRLDTAMLFDEVKTLATAEERRRLAREIHDGIAQEIASLGYVVDSLVADADTEDQRDGLRGLRQEFSRLTSELRLSIFDLRSEVTQSAGLGAVLSDYVRQVGSRSGLIVHLTLAEGTRRLPTGTETEILRIAQEAITNCRKHAAARNVYVSLVVEAPYARLTITDDGRGLGTPREDSFGLRTMRERAERVGAALRVRNRATGSHGTEVTVILDDRRRSKDGSPMQALDDVALPSRAPSARVTDSERGEPSGAYVGPAH